MLIGRDDVGNDVITHGTCFSMFVYICARFHFTLISVNLVAQFTGSQGGNWRNSRDAVARSPSFSRAAASAQVSNGSR